MSDEPKKTRSIEKSVTINAPPEEVWKAIAEAEGIKAWFAPDAQVTPGVGGKVFASWGPGFEGTTRIDIWEPNQRLRTTDIRPEKQAETGYVARAELSVDYVLEGKGGSTVLRLVHSGFGAGADWDDEVDSHNRGWGVFLSNLKHFVEKYRGQRCKQTIAMQPLTGPGADAWSRLLGKNGFAREGRLEGLAVGDKYQVQTAQGDVLEGTVATMDAPGALILDIENLAARLYVTVEKGFLFAAVLAYGPKAEGLASRWQATIDGALKAS